MNIELGQSLWKQLVFAEHFLCVRLHPCQILYNLINPGMRGGLLLLPSPPYLEEVWNLVRWNSFSHCRNRDWWHEVNPRQLDSQAHAPVHRPQFPELCNRLPLCECILSSPPSRLLKWSCSCLHLKQMRSWAFKQWFGQDNAATQWQGRGQAPPAAAKPVDVLQDSSAVFLWRIFL